MDALSRTLGLLMALVLAALILTVIFVGAIVLSVLVPIAILGFIIWFCYQIMKPIGQNDDDKPP